MLTLDASDVIMQTVVSNEREILVCPFALSLTWADCLSQLSNEGTRVWSGQQVQSYNANAILWGALGKEICEYPFDCCIRRS